MYKIVFFDIDGTLVTEQKIIPKSTKKAVMQLKEKGIIPVIATGRAPSLIKEVAAELGIHSAITMNGQYVVVEDQVIFQNPLPAESVARLSTVAQANGHSIAFCGSEGITGNSIILLANRGWLKKLYPFAKRWVPKRVITRLNRLVSKKKIPEEQFANRTIYQCVVAADEQTRYLYQEQFPELHMTSSNAYAVDIVSGGMSKAIGIQKVLDHLELDIEETMAFGDSLNDLEMLQAVGLGIAMGNSKPELKEVADQTTGDVGEDGIYQALAVLGLVASK